MSLDVVSERRPEGAVVHLSGDFDLHTCADARLAVDELLAVGMSPVYVDLSAVTFMDSSGLGTLVGLQKRANTSDLRLVLCGLSTQVGKILDITHLRDAFTIESEAPRPPAG